MLLRQWSVKRSVCGLVKKCSCKGVHVSECVCGGGASCETSTGGWKGAGVIKGAGVGCGLEVQ